MSSDKKPIGFSQMYLQMLNDILDKNRGNSGLNVSCLIMKDGAIKSVGWNHWIAGRSFQSPINYKSMNRDIKDVSNNHCRIVIFGGDMKMGQSSAGIGLIMRLRDKRPDFEYYDSREKMKNHAEMNAIYHRDSIGDNDDMLVNVIPCPNCSKMLMNSYAHRRPFYSVSYLFDNGKYPETWGMAVAFKQPLFQFQNIAKIDPVLELTLLNNTGIDNDKLVTQQSLSERKSGLLRQCVSRNECEPLIDELSSELKIKKDEIKVAKTLEEFNKMTACREYSHLWTNYPSVFYNLIRQVYHIKAGEYD